MYATDGFDPYLLQWQLTIDGQPIYTPNSHLLPVRYQGEPAMLKIADHAEEQRGAQLMIWWAGDGAARVLAYSENALLIERAMGSESLAQMARQGRDDEASRIICSVAATLHAHSYRSAPELIPLAHWFAALEPAASRYGGVFAQASSAAHHLLSEPQEVVILHGDLHHDNVLDADTRGWLAIDPKGLVGERGFDFANLFCNPDQTVAGLPRRLTRQAHVVAEQTGLERNRLIRWILAYAGLSAAWSLDDREGAELALTVAKLAAVELNKG